jgi:hypothetical protein
MGSEATPQGNHAARFAEPSKNQQFDQPEQQPNHGQEQQQLEPAQQQSLDYLLNIINQVAKDDPTGVFEYPVVSLWCSPISSGLGLAPGHHKHSVLHAYCADAAAKDPSNSRSSDDSGISQAVETVLPCNLRALGSHAGTHPHTHTSAPAC